MALLVRPERSGDRAAVRQLVRAAFGKDAEADLIEALHAAGDAVLSLVACDAGRPVGHILFSRLDAPIRALALAPLAVCPGHQHRGIGSRLLRDGLALAKAEGWEAVFVLGDPRFYGRFGFDAGAAARFRTPYDGPHMMALAIGGPLPSAGTVAYPAAFSQLI
jgi:putative acetyltransferase